MTIDSADDSKISNRTINTNRISNRTYDSKSNRITKLRRSLLWRPLLPYRYTYCWCVRGCKAPTKITCTWKNLFDAKIGAEIGPEWVEWFGQTCRESQHLRLGANKSRFSCGFSLCHITFLPSLFTIGWIVGGVVLSQVAPSMGLSANTLCAGKSMALQSQSKFGDVTVAVDYLISNTCHRILLRTHAVYTELNIIFSK